MNHSQMIGLCFYKTCREIKLMSVWLSYLEYLTLYIHARSPGQCYTEYKEPLSNTLSTTLY